MRCAALFGVAALLAGGTARGDGTSFVERARMHYEALEYDQAETALNDALRAGGNSPETTAEIYLLLGQVAGGLERPDLSEEHYKRLLVLRPDAQVASERGPKITAPLTAARAALAGTRPLAIRVESAPPPSAVVTVIVESDPLVMVAGARAEYRTAGGSRQEVKASGRPQIDLAIPIGARDVTVSAVDVHGNRLVDQMITGREAPSSATATATRVSTAPEADSGGGRPLLLHWAVWGGASAAVAGAGVFFAVRARSMRNRLDDWRQDGEPHPYSEASDLDDGGQRYTLLANVSFIAAGALAVVGGVLFATRPASSNAAMVPTTGGDGAAVLFSGRF